MDVIKLLDVGAAVVTSAQVEAAPGFMSFQPAEAAHLDHESARNIAREWLLKAFLRDSIEATGIFLDDCLQACALIELAAEAKSTGKTKASKIDFIFNVLPEKNQKIHFPEKLAKLEREFGVKPPLAPHVLSLNRARSCVVHRLGLVSAKDVDVTNSLTINFRTFNLIAQEVESKKELLLEKSGHVLEADSQLLLRFVDKSRTFALGEHIILAPAELYSCIVTFWQFSVSTCEAIEAYAKSKGLEITAAQTLAPSARNT